MSGILDIGDKAVLGTLEVQEQALFHDGVLLEKHNKSIELKISTDDIRFDVVVNGVLENSALSYHDGEWYIGANKIYHVGDDVGSGDSLPLTGGTLTGKLTAPDIQTGNLLATTATVNTLSIDELVLSTLDGMGTSASIKTKTGSNVVLFENTDAGLKTTVLGELYVGAGKVYTTENKPTANDVGALPLTGGVVDYLDVSAGLSAAILKLMTPTITFDPVQSGSYVFFDSTDTVFMTKSTTGGYQWYAGDSAQYKIMELDNTGVLKATAVYDNGSRVYSPSNPPPMVSTEFVKITGDTMTGGLTVPTVYTGTISNDSAIDIGTTLKLKSTNGIISFDTGTRSIDFYSPTVIDADVDNSFHLEIGQRGDNLVSGKYAGIRVVKYQDSSIVDGSIIAGDLILSDKIIMSGIGQTNYLRWGKYDGVGMVNSNVELTSHWTIGFKNPHIGMDVPQNENAFMFDVRTGNAIARNKFSANIIDAYNTININGKPFAQTNINGWLDILPSSDYNGANFGSAIKAVSYQIGDGTIFSVDAIGNVFAANMLLSAPQDMSSNAVVRLDYLNSVISELDWNDIMLNHPTTLAGYGITDAAASSHVGATGAEHGVASTSVAGFMSAEDKTKLDGIATGANEYTHPVSGVTAGTYRSVAVDENGHITAGTNPTTLAEYGITDAVASTTTINGKPLTANITLTAADVGAIWDTTMVTTTTDGLMSYTDKIKLDGLVNYVHPVSGVTAGTYRSVAVDENGHITAGTNPTTLAGYGITDGLKSEPNDGLSAYTYSGLFRLNAANENAPSGASGIGDHVLNAHWDVNAATQIYLPYSNDSTFAWRRKAGGVYQPWNRIYHEGYKPSAADVNAVAKTGDTMSGHLTMAQDTVISFDANSTWGGKLRVGGNGRTASNDGVTASVTTTNGNLHLDGATGSRGVYLNFYSGTAGVVFGNGAGASVGEVSNTGAMTLAASVTAPIFVGNLNGTATNADALDSIDSTGFARAFSGSYTFGNAPTGITTAEFITILTNLGAFNQPFWFAKGSWQYAYNNYITDTGFGYIQLAGATIEVMGNSVTYTIRIHTSPTVSIAGSAINGDFVYVNHGESYSPTWHRLYSTSFKPTAVDINALPITGGTLTGPVSLQTIQGQGSSIGWASIDVTGTKGGYAGINFPSAGHWFGVQPNGTSGVWDSGGNSKWYFNELGTLTGGAKVPWGIVTDRPEPANWVERSSINTVGGMLAWKNYGNGHVIFDASAGTSPSGAVVGNKDPQIGWGPSYPTLMGWNGANTYGVRVDSSRVADSASLADRLTGIVSTIGQDLKIHDKRAIVGNYEGNQLIINYGNDWGSTVIAGNVFTGQTQSDKLIVTNGGSSSYGDAGIEVRVTDGATQTPRISLHRPGICAAAFRLDYDNTVVLETANPAVLGSFVANHVYSNAGNTGAVNELTRTDYVLAQVNSSDAFRFRGAKPDANTSLGLGSYYWHPSVANSPIGNTFAHGLQFGGPVYGDGSWVSDITFIHGQGLYHRATVNGGFAGWTKFAWAQEVNYTATPTQYRSTSSWVGLVSGVNGADAVVMGTNSGAATVGAHSNGLDAWTPLYVNCHPNSSNTAPVVLSVPKVKLPDNNTLYDVWHSGNFDPNSKLNTTGGTVSGQVYNSVTGAPNTFVGGKISSESGTLSLDANSYAFVTSPLDVHLCFNSRYQPSVGWVKYDNNKPSGKIVINEGSGLQYVRSDAGASDTNQYAYNIYHIGNLNPIEKNTGNVLNNSSFGVGFLSSGDSGPQWISGYFGKNGGASQVVIGENNGMAVIGGHNAAKTAWAPLLIGMSPNGPGNEITYISRPYAVPAGSNVAQEILHRGIFDPDSKLSNNGSGGTLYLNNWFRSTGTTGWYNETHGGGIYMDESSTVKVFGGKNFSAPANLSVGNDMSCNYAYANGTQPQVANALTRLDYVLSKTTAFGLGAASPVSRQNWNEVLQPTGWYEYNGDGGDSGGPTAYGEIHTITSGNAGAYGGWAKQIFYSTGGDAFHRTAKAGGFSGKPWYKFWDSNNFDPDSKLNAAGGTLTGPLAGTYYKTNDAGAGSNFGDSNFGYYVYGKPDSSISYGMSLLDPAANNKWGTNIFSSSESNRFIYFTKKVGAGSDYTNFTVAAAVDVTSGEIYAAGGTKQVLHTGNYTPTLDSRYVQKTGDTLTGPLSLKTITGQGSSIGWASIDVTGTKGGYAGFNFTDAGHWFGVRPDGLSGVWDSGGNSKWYFNELGTLSGGAKVPWSIVTDRPEPANWVERSSINTVGGMLAWKNYGNGHVIFDASAGTSPNGTVVDKNNAQIAWSSTYPTLMGWNGANTYGVRVDSARLADSANWAAQSDRATYLNGTVATSGQDITIHAKRAIVGVGDSNQLTINYANDWGSTLIQGQTYLQTVESNRHVVVHNGSTVYSNSGLEVRTTDGSDARIGFHRSGHSAGAINHNVWGFQFERESGGGSRANVAAANFFADAEQSSSNNALTRKDYVDGALSSKFDKSGGTVSGTVYNSVTGAPNTFVGGKISSEAGTLSLDAYTHAFVTSPLDVHLCYNARYQPSTGWQKYDSARTAGRIVINEVGLLYVRSDAGTTEASQYTHSIWHSGNFNPDSKLSENGHYGGTLKLNNWFRSVGDSGWYSETHGGGIHMDEATTVKVYNGKKFYVANTEHNAIGATGGIFSYRGMAVDTRTLVGNGSSYNYFRYNDAPFHAGLGGLNTGSFAPIVGSANWINGAGYTTRVQFGVVTPGGGGWSNAVIMVGSAENDAHPLAAYNFGADGHMSGLGAITLSGDANIGNDMICNYAYANGTQPQVGNALTRKDYVDGRDYAMRWENQLVPNHGGGDANAHYNSAWDGAGVANAPSADWHFFRELYHSGGANWRHQEAFNFFADEEWFRRGINAAEYGPWRRRWHSGNFDPDTKLNISGGTITGSLTVTTVISTPSFTLTSDIRKKKTYNTDKQIARNNFMDVTFLDYSLLTDKTDNINKTGVVAQQLEETEMKKYVHTDENDDKSVDYISLYAHLLDGCRETIKDLQLTVQELQKQLKQLTGE